MRLLQPRCYPAERSRIALLISLLSDQAAEWAMAVQRVNQDTAFTTQLRAAFNIWTAKVETICDRVTVRYITELWTLVGQTTWSATAIRTVFCKGLAPQLK